MAMVAPRWRLCLSATAVFAAQAAVAVGTTSVIDRASVVARHTVHFAHTSSTGVDAAATAFNALTVGNGDFAFGADLTGLQSLNNSYHVPDYPLYTLSNWGWHAPHPELLGATQPMFRADGQLNYVYENVTINSSDTRPGKGNRTVPYQFNCADYNDKALCDCENRALLFFLLPASPTNTLRLRSADQHNFPARVNLGQLAFVLPGRSPNHAGPHSTGPHPGCSGVGSWCNTAQVVKDHSSGGFTCKDQIEVVASAAAATTGTGGCNETASCGWAGGWKDAPFCPDATTGEIQMSGVHPATHSGYFDGSCDRIKWNNTFDRSSWCRAGSKACDPTHAPAGGGAQPAGDFRFLELGEITEAAQSLDMYSGHLSSNWTHTDNSSSSTAAAAVGNRVSVLTVVDNATDTVAARYTAPAAMGLAVQLAFCTITKHGGACEWRPYGSPDGPLEDHKTTVLHNSSGRLDLFRENGPDTYSVSCTWSGADDLVLQQTAPHAFVLHRPAAATATADTAGAETVEVELSCRFQLNCCVGDVPPVAPDDLSAKAVPSAPTVLSNSEASWADFWEGGAFVDIAGSTDNPQAFELERRTIQSMYLLRSQESGSIMPQESGLLYNSWDGKHHSEMRYWHQTWLPLWGHPELLARSDEWFLRRLQNATAHTAHQGYKGTRWGKMLGEANMWGHGKGDGSKPIMYWESPNNCNPGLVWHQPHVVYMSELEYRAAKTPAAKLEVLHRLKDVVLSTAEFLADFPERRIGTGTHGKSLDLGPPLVSASEGEGPYDVWNPSYELTQFNFSLDLANRWRQRLGMKPNADWETVRMNLAPLPVAKAPGSGKPVYNRHENCLPSVFADKPAHCSGAKSHPALNGAMGCLPGDRYGVDREIMNNTLHETLRVWEWGNCWGKSCLPLCVCVPPRCY